MPAAIETPPTIMMNMKKERIKLVCPYDEPELSSPGVVDPLGPPLPFVSGMMALIPEQMLLWTRRMCELLVLYDPVSNLCNRNTHVR